MKKYSTKMIKNLEGEVLLSDSFHRSTRNQALDNYSSKKISPYWIKIHYKSYPRFKSIPLMNLSRGGSELRQILYKRYSARHYSKLPLSFANISYILQMSAGLVRPDKDLDKSRRGYPSAGARYPLEIYFISLNAELDKGLYHYNIKENSLEILIKKNLSKWLLDTTGNEDWIVKSGIVVIITGVMDRTRIKYTDRGYRYILMEVGHVGQNISLLSTELGLGSCILGGFIDNKVNDLLDITFQKEYALSMITIGNI